MSNPLDINFDLSQTKTACPLIADGTYATWRVDKVTADTKKLEHAAVGVVSGDLGSLLKIEYVLTEPVPDSDGKQIIPPAPGSRFFETINLYSKPDAKDTSWFVKKIASRVDALLGTGDPENSKNKPVRPPLNIADPAFASELEKLIKGTTLKAKMKISKSDEYGTRNEMAAVYFPADLAA